MEGIFSDIRILDLSEGMSGSVATMVFADFGAEVIKVEPPSGDAYRKDPAWKQWNRGKKSIAIDLETSDGKDTLSKLIKESDVLLHSFRPVTTIGLGLEYERIKELQPQIIYASLSGFGKLGPYSNYKSYEGIVAAKSGRFMSFAGQSHSQREGPHYSAVQVGSHGAGMALVRGICAALLLRDQTGIGQEVETTILQNMAQYDFRDCIIWQLMVTYPDLFPEDPWGGSLRQPTPGYMPIRTKDGKWIQLANILDRPFHASIRALGLDHIYAEPRFAAAPMLSAEAAEELREMILSSAKEKTMSEWMDLFVNVHTDVAAEPFMTAKEGLEHPQIIYNAHVQEVNDPEVGIMKQLGPLALLSSTPGAIRGPAPLLGANTDEIVNMNRPAPAANSGGNTTNATLPEYTLEGITVLDLASVIAGPLACALLREMGARVIRIEPPDGDFGRKNQHGLLTQRTMAGAESISVDIKTPEGKKIVQELCSKADILVHNMRPGTTDRLGIGYEEVSKSNPGMIYVYAGGYGDSGPYSHRPAMHPIPGAICGGAMAQLGKNVLPSADEEMSMADLKNVARMLGRANEGNPDPNSSMVISAACLMGLYARQRTGKGQYIVSTMIAANGYANADDFFDYEGKPSRSIPDGDGYGPHALYRLYETLNGWIFLACPMEEEWPRLCNALGIEELIQDRRFKESADRMNNDRVLVETLSSIFASRKSSDWETTLSQLDIACVEAEDSGPYQFYANDPQVEANQLTVNVDSLKWGSFWRHSPVLKFSQTKSTTGAAPLQGQHNESVLRELGYSDIQIEDFQSKKVLLAESL
jgi:crotonobetainyl-CoA:carnitine CoA-transferase CaiB-like acyl-CoA transferase